MFAIVVPDLLNKCCDNVLFCAVLLQIVLTTWYCLASPQGFMLRQLVNIKLFTIDSLHNEQLVANMITTCYGNLSRLGQLSKACEHILFRLVRFPRDLAFVRFPPNIFVSTIVFHHFVRATQITIPQKKWLRYDTMTDLIIDWIYTYEKCSLLYESKWRYIWVNMYCNV